MIHGRALVVADRLCAAGFGIFVSYAAASLLGAEAFGLFVAFEAVRVGILTCADRTIGQAFVVHAAAHPRTSSATAAAALALKLASVVVFAGIALMAWLVGPRALGETSYELALWLPAWVLLSMVHTTVQQSLNARRAYGALALTDGVPLVLFVAALAFIDRESATPALLMSVSCLVRALGGLLFARELAITETPQWKRAAELLRFARAAFVNNLATYLSLRGDGLLLAAFATLTAAAQWGLVAPLVNAYMLIGEAANLEILPEISEAAAAGRHERVRTLVRQALGIWCGVSVALSCVCFLSPIEALLPGDAAILEGVGSLFALVALAGPCLVVARIFAAVNNGYGQPVRNAQASLAGLALKSSVGAALIYGLGAFGAAGAMIATTATVMVVSGFYAMAAWRDAEEIAMTRTA